MTEVVHRGEQGGRGWEAEIGWEARPMETNDETNTV